VRQGYAILGVKSGIVRSAMREHPDHLPGVFLIDGRSVEIENSCDTAHAVLTSLPRVMAVAEIPVPRLSVRSAAPFKLPEGIGSLGKAFS
jgi:hypothetical protein